VELSDLKCFVDSSGELTLDEVGQFEFTESDSLGMAVLKKLNPSRNVWFRFTVRFLEPPEDTVAFQLPTFSRTEVYRVLADGSTELKELGMEEYENYFTTNRNQRVFPLGFNQGEPMTFYVKAMHRARVIFLSDQFYVYFDFLDSFDARKMEYRPSRGGEGYLFLLFCGIMAFQLLYVLLQWFLVRRREYFYYALYVLTVFLYYFLRFSALFVENPDWAFFDNKDLYLYNDYLLILPSIFYFRFVSAFADLRVRDRKLYRHFKYFEMALWFCLLVQLGLNLFPNDYNKFAAIILSVVIQLPFIVYGLVRILRQKRQVLRFLLVGSVFAFAGHLIANLKPWLFPGFLSGFSPPEITMIGILFEVVIFNAGLLFKARETDRERADAQESYIRELKNRQAIQAEFSHIRDKISSDLHDDVGSSLSSIGIYSYAAKQNLQVGDTQQTSKLLDNIKESAESTLNSMSDLVWATNPRNDSNEKLIERIKSFGFEILSAKDCLFSCEVDDEFLEMSFNQATRKNLLLLLKEGINNAAKYSGASKVSLTIETISDQKVSVVVADNGVGMNLANITPGNGMRTMKKRAAEIGGELKIDSTPEGTVIVLIF
jgi:signal transduction histidine kinase